MTLSSGGRPSEAGARAPCRWAGNPRVEPAWDDSDVGRVGVVQTDQVLRILGHSAILVGLGDQAVLDVEPWSGNSSACCWRLTPHPAERMKGNDEGMPSCFSDSAATKPRHPEIGVDQVVAFALAPAETSTYRP